MSRSAAEYMRDNPPPSPRQWLPKCRECGGHGADPLSDNVNWLPCKSCGGSGVQSSTKHSAPLRSGHDERDYDDDTDALFSAASSANHLPKEQP